jgi:hypothetical protein
VKPTSESASFCHSSSQFPQNSTQGDSPCASNEKPSSQFLDGEQQLFSNWLERTKALAASGEDPDELVERSERLIALRLSALKTNEDLSSPCTPLPKHHYTFIHPDKLLNLGYAFAALGYRQKDDPHEALCHALAVTDPNEAACIKPLMDAYIREAEVLLATKSNNERLFLVGLGWNHAAPNDYRIYTATAWARNGNDFFALEALSDMRDFSKCPRCKELVSGYLRTAQRLLETTPQAPQLESIAKALQQFEHRAISILGNYYLSLMGNKTFLCPAHPTKELTPAEIDDFPEVNEALTFFRTQKGIQKLGSFSKYTLAVISFLRHLKGLGHSPYMEAPVGHESK